MEAIPFKELRVEREEEIAGIGVSRGPIGEYIVWALGPARESYINCTSQRHMRSQER